MKIALDAMGGDKVPGEIIRGAVEGALTHGVEVVLVGPQALLEPELARYNHTLPGIAIAPASQAVAMDEPPLVALKKGDTSIQVGLELLRDGRVDGFVSAGHSGAVVAAALMVLGKLEGVDRPAIGTVFPLPTGPALLLDVGATPDCKPQNLLQFAYLGRHYLKQAYGIANPRVGLLSNGAEPAKGNSLVRRAHQLLAESDLNFIGNVEGQEVSRGRADVVVTDGFTGNIIMKVGEGVGEMLYDTIKQATGGWLHLQVAAGLLRPALEPFFKRLDYTEYGGGMLLGVKGNVIVAHGRSNAKAIASALGMAKRSAVGEQRGAWAAIPVPPKS
ncbi:MAG: phosphate acyltransferase PlsX [Chloroflexi bacterium]|nr:phosphate acyltransferase PlsX [Chloroflexota bacterium]